MKLTDTQLVLLSGASQRQDDGIELLAPHSITSSARDNSKVGTSRPRAFAVLRLTTGSNLVGWHIGRSAGRGRTGGSRCHAFSTIARFPMNVSDRQGMAGFDPATGECGSHYHAASFRTGVNPQHLKLCPDNGLLCFIRVARDASSSDDDSSTSSQC
jgi:hypothetical protein